MAAQMTSSATRYEPKMLHAAVKRMARNDVHPCMVSFRDGWFPNFKSCFPFPRVHLKTLTTHDHKLTCSNLKCQLSEATWLAKSCTECWIRGQLFNLRLKSLNFGKVCHGTPLASLWEVLMESSPGHQVAAAGEMMGMRSSYWRTEVRVK